MINRRNMLQMALGTGAALGMTPLCGCSFFRAADAGGGRQSLAFDPSDFTLLTATVATKQGNKTVTYRFHKAIPYVAKPVDPVYQCLNVSVPVEIDGVAVDTADAPILFSIGVGGYMPSSVADADGVGGSGLPPMSLPPGIGTGVASGGNAMIDRSGMVSNAKLALAAGYVVVEPGARGRTLIDENGTYYGVAPAAIVDLKAAVRYVRFNRGRVPGNVDRIVSSGTSAGGGLSALLGASGDSPLYRRHLAELGAAEASDAIFASGDWCPITDLEHADMAYEWNWGANPLASGQLADRSVTSELSAAFVGYQSSLGLSGKGGFGRITAENYADYLLKTYLRPAASHYVAALDEAARAAYLAENRFIAWEDGTAKFSWNDYLVHVGARRKNAPAFDAFDLSAGENNLFGVGTLSARHFTSFSLRHATGNADARLDDDLPEKLVLMNPMPFILARNAGRARHWWIRVGAKDSDTALTVVGNLAVALENAGDDVNTAMYWDAGHGANEDADAFIEWMGRISASGAPDRL